MDTLSINRVSAILITKEKEYPATVISHVKSYGFGEIIILTECNGIYRRFLIEPKYRDIYVQDDDCLPPIDLIFKQYDGNTLTCGMSPHHISIYRHSRICLIGHGAFFPYDRIKVLEKYKLKFGTDENYHIETDRIFTFLNYPQKRVAVELTQLPSSFNEDRLSMRKEHYSDLYQIEKKLIKFYYLSRSDHNIFYNIVLCKYFNWSHFFHQRIADYGL